jgi:SAM-dependent methyltransferase
MYQSRFDPATLAAKRELWNVLAEKFLQRCIPMGAAVAYAEPDVEIIMSYPSAIGALPDASLDVACAGNFLEHLSSKEVLFELFSEIRWVLKKGGKLLILRPNIKYAYREYWDVIDHHLPLTENSLGKALTITGYRVAECIPRFLPFSVGSSPSKSTGLLRLYLRMPPAWRLFGKQTLMVGAKE